MEQKIQNINQIFKQLGVATLTCLSIQKQCQPPLNLADFGKSCYETKVKILKLLISHKNEIKEQQLEHLCLKLKLLGSSNEHLLEIGLINLYIDIYQVKKKSKQQNKQEIKEVCIQLLSCLEEPMRYFFLQHQLKQLNKHKNIFELSSSIDAQNQRSVVQQQIRRRIANKKCEQMLKQYLKDQQANKNKELCRICYKQIQVSILLDHVEYCSKKTLLKEQLNQVFQNKTEIINKLQQLCNSSQIQNDKNMKVIRNVIDFYNCQKNNDKKKKKHSLLRQQNNQIKLLFYQNQIHEQHQIGLLNDLLVLQDKAFCLWKKIQEIQNQFQQTNNKNKVKSKPSHNLRMKKYQTISKEINQFNAFNINNQQSLENVDKKQMPDIQQINEQQIEVQEPVKVERRLKKKLTDCQRYSITKSDSNFSQTDYHSMSINNFQILKLLGKGAFGRVYLARRKKTKDVYALKAIKIDKNWGQSQLELIKNEYGIYKKIAGDHLVTATFSFQQNNVQFFALQYMPGGDLSKILEENIYLQENQARFYLAQILLAIDHLHSSQIIHRDLKPENIVLDSRGHIKLTDFGLSQIRVQNKIKKARDCKNMQQKQKYSKSSVKKQIIKNKNDKKLVGTPDYIAPEVISGVSLANPTIDWWSFGVIAYQMLIGCRPFSANEVQQIFKNIEKGDIQWPEIGEQEDMMSPVAADFVKRLLNKDFNQRLGSKGVQEIKNHEFFKDIDWQNIKTTIPPISLPKPVQQFQQLAENSQLKKQILILMGQNGQKKLQQLKNYVRYDLLTAQTLVLVQKSTNQKEKRLRKLKSIAYNYQNIEPSQIKQQLLKLQKKDF